MRLTPTELGEMTISRKDLLSVTTNRGYFPLNRELLESREIERLRKYLFSFELNDGQKKAALELVNCLTALEGKDRDCISSVVNISSQYVGYRHTITKETYEIRAKWYLTQPSEGLQLLGGAMLALAIVFAIIAVALMAATASVSIPAIVVIPTIGLLGMGFFASGCKYQTRLSTAMHGLANTFDNRPDTGPTLRPLR